VDRFVEEDPIYGPRLLRLRRLRDVSNSIGVYVASCPHRLAYAALIFFSITDSVHSWLPFSHSKGQEVGQLLSRLA
jgi:hypothetical protein